MAESGDDYKYESVALRLSRYEHSIKRCTYIGGGIGGLLVLVGLNGNSIVNAPLWLRASVITLAVLSGASLGRSYLGFASAQQDTIRNQKQDNLPDGALAESVVPYPNSSHTFYVLAILFLMIASGLVIVGAWWPTENQAADALIQRAL